MACIDKPFCLSFVHMHDPCTFPQECRPLAQRGPLRAGPEAVPRDRRQVALHVRLLRQAPEARPGLPRGRARRGGAGAGVARALRAGAAVLAGPHAASLHAQHRRPVAGRAQRDAVGRLPDLAPGGQPGGPAGGAARVHPRARAAPAAPASRPRPRRWRRCARSGACRAPAAPSRACASR